MKRTDSIAETRRHLQAELDGAPQVYTNSTLVMQLSQIPELRELVIAVLRSRKIQVVE